MSYGDDGSGKQREKGKSSLASLLFTLFTFFFCLHEILSLFQYFFVLSPKRLSIPKRWNIMDDFYGLFLEENIFIFIKKKIARNIYQPDAIAFYDALNDDFNLINNEPFKAVDDGAIESILHPKRFPLKLVPSMHPNICLSFNKQFRKELI